MIWAIVVPIAAKLLDRVEEILHVQLFEQTFEIHFGLPFSWKILFVAAITFLVANVIYELFCPSLIKETASYKDFEEQKRSGTELYFEFERLKRQSQIEPGVADRWRAWLTNRLNAAIQHHNYSAEHDELAFTEAYAEAVIALAQTHFYARFFASLAYLLGLLAIGLIILQNVYFVARHW